MLLVWCLLLSSGACSDDETRAIGSLVEKLSTVMGSISRLAAEKLIKPGAMLEANETASSASLGVDRQRVSLSPAIL